MQLLTKKNALLGLQILTVFGILVGLVAGLLIVNEMTDVYMLDGVLIPCRRRNSSKRCMMRLTN